LAPPNARFDISVNIEYAVILAHGGILLGE
jgi:hypothetical protein